MSDLSASIGQATVMSIQVIVAFCLWPIVTFGLFQHLGATRGLVASVVGGFLLLPAVGWQPVAGLPMVTRDGVIAMSALAAMLALVPGATARYRFHWLDLVVLAGLFGWGFTNIATGIGIEQALHDWWWFAMFAAIPYFLARCLLDRPSAMVTLAIGIVAGCLLMLPFVVFELRMSPATHAWLYGIQVGHGFEMARYGGWRPRVFQPAGLGMAIWLSASAVVAVGLYLSKSVAAVWRIPAALVAGACLVLGVLCRGGGAISLMVGGLGVLILSYWSRMPRLTLLVPAAVGLYLLTAFTDLAVPIRPFMLSAGELVWGEGAGGSLRVRVENEAFLVVAAMQKPLFGYGGWGDFRSNLELARQMGVDRVLTDGLWTIVLGQRGLWGVMCLYGMFLLPGLVAVNAAVRAGLGVRPMMVVAGLSMFCWLYAADLLLNAFATPVIGVTTGALASFAVSIRSSRVGRRRVAVGMTSAARSGDARRAASEGFRRPEPELAEEDVVSAGAGGASVEDSARENGPT